MPRGCSFDEPCAANELAVNSVADNSRNVSKQYPSTNNATSAGDSSDDVYFILTGRVEVVLNANTGGFVVREQGPPGLIGEMGVFRHAPRSATIRTMEPVKALRIKAETFLSFLSNNPAEARHVMRQLSEKLAVCHRQLEALQASPQRSTGTPPGG